MAASIGRLIAKERRRKGMTQARLAELTGYTAVMIAKIESGARKPAVHRLPDFANALDIPLAVLQGAAEAAKPAGGPTAIVQAMRMGEANAVRAKVLRRRSEDLKNRTDDAAVAYQRWVDAAIDEAIEPLVTAAAMISDVPEDLLIPAGSTPTRSAGKNVALLADIQESTASRMRTFLFTGAASLAAGAVSGGAAGAGTFAAVASMATASTGTAIASLHGVAATSATLAWLGGGALTAGGAGIAGGTLALTGIVALPLVVVTGSVLAIQGRRLLEQQSKAARQLERAEADLEHNAAVMGNFIRWTGAIGNTLEFATARVQALLPDILEDSGADSPKPFAELSADAAASLRTCGQLVTTMLTLLALPVALQQAPGDRDSKDSADGFDQVSTRLLRLDPETEAFIDFAIEASKKQVARA